VHISSEGFSLLGVEKGYNLYGHSPVVAGTPLVVSVSGTASAPSGSNAQPSVSASSGETITVLPSQVFRMSWILAVMIALVMIFGGIVLWRKSAADRIVATNDNRRGKNKNENSRPRAVYVRSSGDGHKESLEEIKDKLFSLEIRHQAGTVGEEHYQHERHEMEGLLRQFAALER
jgi:hypothetical protein